MSAPEGDDRAAGQANQEVQALVDAVRVGLWERADATKAPAMQAYMKSRMPYVGVQAPGQREVFRSVFPAHRFDTIETWRDAVLTLWRDADFREERYAAIALAGYKAYGQFQRPATIPIYEEMIETGAWWDYVDAVAIHRIGPILDHYRDEVTATLRTWIDDPHIWKRRAAIIAQIQLGDRVNFDLLSAAIQANSSDKAFFIRKAIGWALRELAKRNPDAVDSFLADHELSNLSRREAQRGIAIGRTRPERRTGDASTMVSTLNR